MSEVIDKPRYECKHVLYFPIRDGSKNDLLVIKERVHLPDGTTKPNLRLRYNQPRPFYITKPAFRNHKEKKESEEIKKLDRFECTEIELVDRVARALGKVPNQRTRLRELARSPYLYGTDASPELLIKERYKRANPSLITPNTVAVLDVETNMLSDEEEIIMGSVTFKERVFIGVTKWYCRDIHDFENRLRKRFTELLGNYEEARKIKLEIEILENDGAVAKRMIEKCHEWMPDVVAVWNISFDIKKICESLERHGHNLADVFSDPSIPAPFRYFNFIEGKASKTSASGKKQTFDPEQRWHTVECPSSFYFLDAMCVYWRVRMAAGKLQSAALDAILMKHLGIRKLKFEEASHLEKRAWHEFMQRNFKVEYAVYNLFDCISMELLDEKILDMSTTVPMLLGSSPYKNFASQPSMTWDAMQFVFMEKGEVAATTSDKMATEFDEMVVSLKDWILTLPTHPMAQNGVPMFSDLPDLLSYIRTDAADLDIEGTYPNGQCCANISRKTTRREIIQIGDLDPMDRRRFGINLTGAHVNAVELAVMAFKAKSFDQALEAWDRSKALEGRTDVEKLLEVA